MFVWTAAVAVGVAMSSNWFAKHFGCWSGHEQTRDGHQQRQAKKNQKQVSGVEKGLDKMSIMRNSSKRFGQHQNCAKDGVVKCCDKFCKNNCNLSMMRNDLKGNVLMMGNRRSFNSRTSKSCNWSLVGGICLSFVALLVE